MSTSGPSGQDGPHAFVADIERPVLDEGDRHHLGHVLRLRTGDTFTVSDGDGHWRLCRFGGTQFGGVVEPVGAVATVPEAQPSITVAFALVKGERPEWVTQKLTELGVDEIRPFLAARSVVRWDEEKSARATVRLRRIAREAAMQSRRCRLPIVHPPARWAEVAALDGAAMAERGAPALDLTHPTVLIGPEGGWAAPELEVGLPRVGLATSVLRADTAAICAGVLLTTERAGMRPFR